MIQVGGFVILASLILLGAVIVIFAKNPVHNAMGLVLTLLSLAILYLTMSVKMKILKTKNTKTFFNERKYNCFFSR